jgi:DNA-binding NtrC family response regulator
MKPTSVMIVENNPDLRTTLRHAFEDRGFITWTFPSPEIAISIFSTFQPTVIILDLDVAGSQACEMIDTCREQCPLASLIVESNSEDSARMQEAMEHGAQAFLVKPYALAPLFEIINQKIPPRPPMVIPMTQAA